MTTNLLELWVAEYSPSQNATHVHTVDDAMNSNLRMILSGNANDYLMIGLAPTHDEASAICDALRKKLDEHTARSLYCTIVAAGGICDEHGTAR